jgi:DNA-binding winged helix-turn-helix (wHTH) protein/pimeloyl-ACP methyl ester carboxylesterase
MVYHFGSFELDSDRFELRHDGKPCPLEPQVFDLLRYLIESRDHVVTRDELLEAVWAGRIVSDSTLSSRVKAVRQAIGDSGGEQKWIQTVHGRGFRFIGIVRVVSSTADLSAATEDRRARDDSAELRQEVRYCRTRDGVRIAFARVGVGPCLVKAANWMSHLEYDWESPIWRHWIAGLARNHELIRYDERGNGLSDREVADLSFEAMVADLETVVDALGLERFALFGISQGCAVSVEYAVRHPGRVTCLVLYGGFVKGWRKQGDEGETARREAMSTLIRAGWGQDNPAFRQIFTSRFMPGASPEQMNWFNELQRSTVSAENAARLHDEFGEIDVSRRLSSVRVPTLVLHARNDAEIPLEAGRAFATHIPGARFVTLESENHILLAQEPAFERLVNEIDIFLGEDGN